MRRFILPLTAVAALLALAACGGGASNSVATGSGGTGGATSTLSYVNPPAAEAQGQFALVLDTGATTSSALVLDLVGPATSPVTPACGVTFGFNVDTTRAAWAATPVTNGTLFTVGTLCQGWVNGQTLQGIAANKGLLHPVDDVSAAVIGKISLTPVSGGPAGQVSLVDNGLGTVLDPSGTPYAVPVVVGTLTLK